MNPVEPSPPPEGATLVVFAKDQPQYLPLPAYRTPDGVVLTEWEPTAEELQRILLGGRVRIWIYTFGRPLQPIRVEAAEPECGMRG